MNPRIRRAAPWAALFAVALSGAPGRSQSAPLPAAPAPAPAAAPAGEEGFFETIDVNVVNVEVYVTDKRGNRVKGLTKDDFELFQDGKPVAISNFYAVDDGKPITPPSETAPATTEPAPAPMPVPQRPGVTAAEVPDDQRLDLVVYVDNWNIKPFNRNRVFVGLRNFLRNRLSPGDRVMLMTFDREPHLRRPFTSDPAIIASALFEIEKLSANGTRLDSERREVLGIIRDAENANAAYSRVRSYAESLHNDLSFSIDSLRDLVASLAGLPGRKAILYVSDGLELVPGEDVFSALQDKFKDASSVLLEAHEFDLSRRFQELVASANANRISFYSLDAGGLRMSSASSAEERNPSTTAYTDQIYWGNLQGSIQMMAEDTGGLTIMNTNDPAKGLEIVAADFRNYYSLGYATGTGDGRYHKVDVKTKRKDLLVRHRDGYRDKPVETRMSDGVMAALHFDFESNPLGVVIERGEESARDDGNFLVAIVVRIPIGKLVLVPQGDRQVARVRLFFAALDDQGGLSEVQEARVPIELSAAEAAQIGNKVMNYPVPLIMRRGAQKLAVGLRDELGQVSSFTVRTMRVGG
jgi:VWFA-related protein